MTFTKMSGSGNDFILMDNRKANLPITDLPGFARRLCCRRMSVGADGLILVEESRDDDIDFEWQFFNSDGSLAEMCGNGARCAARFALLEGIAEPHMKFQTLAGVISAEVLGEGGQVKIGMTDPCNLKIDQSIALGNDSVQLSSVNTGVPHVVLLVDDVAAIDVVGLGREIRNHAAFAPVGTNVNFLSPKQDGGFFIRTYERGVEDETLACGTGNVAAAIVATEKLGVSSPVVLTTRSGIDLTISFKKDADGFSHTCLQGDARIIYRAELCEDAWDYQF
jgi:diaminopimelate epimerase